MLCYYGIPIFPIYMWTPTEDNRRFADSTYWFTGIAVPDNTVQRQKKQYGGIGTDRSDGGKKNTAMGVLCGAEAKHIYRDRSAQDSINTSSPLSAYGKKRTVLCGFHHQTTLRRTPLRSTKLHWAFYGTCDAINRLLRPSTLSAESTTPSKLRSDA